MMIVSGHGRCGSSLVMQMLSAGGMPTLGRAPAFEVGEMEPSKKICRNFLARHADTAVKILDPHHCLSDVPADTHAIWMDRDPVQQARSQIKFMRAVGLVSIESKRSVIRTLAKSYSRDTPIALRRLRQICATVTRMRFEDVLADPAEAASQLAHVAMRCDRMLSVPMMTQAVRLRSSDCMPGMDLELALIREASP